MNIMWNNTIAGLPKYKLIFLSGLVALVLMALGVGKAYAVFPDPAYEGFWWSPNHGNSVVNGTNYNLISDDAYMQHVVSRDGYTDILDTTLKIYSTDPYISVEVFGADLCTNQPSYTTDEFFGSNSRSAMYTSFRVGPGDDETTRTGVYARSGVTRLSATTYGNYEGSACTSTNARRYMEARSNVFDESMGASGMYVFNFTAAVGSTAPSGFVNGFRVRVLRNTTTSSGVVISQDPGLSADHFGIETGYPRDDNGNPGASSTYPNFTIPFVPDCGPSAGGQKYITVYDDDQNNSSVQGSQYFKVRVDATNGADTVVPLTNITGEINSGAMTPDASGYYTVIGGNKNYVRLYFNMDPNQSYVFRVINVYQDNTLQISLPGTTSSTARNCPRPATLHGVKIDDSTVGTTYIKAHTGPYKDMGVRVQNGGTTLVSSPAPSTNPFLFTDNIPITRPISGNDYTVRLDAIPSGWALLGATICESTQSTCTNTWLADKNNIAAGRTGMSFLYNFDSDKTYYMRWIFTPDKTINCDPQPTFNPYPDVFTPFTYTGGVYFSPSTYVAPSPTMSMRVTNSAGTQIYSKAAAAVIPSGGRASTTSATIPAVTTAGNYTFYWTYTDASPRTETCSRTVYIGHLPYVNVLGGDIWAGSNGDTAADIRSWNRDNNPAGAGWGGAGAQHAALTSGTIANFATARLLAGGATAPSALGFSNTTVNVPNAQYGGAFDSIPNRTDYYARYLATAPVATAVTDVDLDLITVSGVYNYAGDISLHGAVGRALDVTILAAGNVYISNGSGARLGYYAYTSFADIPKLKVFTAQNKNILVSSAVNEIHGLFAAGNGGRFYSCALNITTPVTYETVGANYATCSTNQLKIYGSVQADELVLSRTFSSLRQVNSAPAEMFVYSPEQWMAQPTYLNGGGLVDPSSYLNLPPVL